MSILFVEPACVDYILEVQYSGKPVVLNEAIVDGLSGLGMAGSGPNILELCKILHKRGFDFKLLERRQHDSAEVTTADHLLSNAVHNGDVKLVRFLVKEAGLASKPESIVVAKEIAYAGVAEVASKFMEAGGNISFDARRTSFSPKCEALEKYRCAMCNATCATKSCAGCKQTRYCSATCQTAGWKSGHKLECKEFRKRVGPCSPIVAGSSNSQRKNYSMTRWSTSALP